MRAMILLIAVVAAIGAASAADLGGRMPVKPATPSTSPPPDPAVLRQGGDTIATAFVIPSVVGVFQDSGTTVGYTNDYDAACPYTGSTSPDVVYEYVAEPDAPVLTINLCYSSYDTKVYVYDESLNVIACNDDYYFSPPCYPYSSAIFDLPIVPGETYYIVVDGYYGASGNYEIEVSGYPPDPFVCPEPNFPESEPDLYDGYVDDYNGGCNTPPADPFQDLVDLVTWPGTLTLCGESGWYISAGGSQYRDTDWYFIAMGYDGAIDVTVEAAHPTYIFELGPQDCSSVAVIQSATGGAFDPGYMTITGYEPGEVVWFWAGPTTFVSPDGSHPYVYDYACWFSGLWYIPCEVQTATWSTMKALFE